MSRGFWHGGWIVATKAYSGHSKSFVASLRKVGTKRNFLEHLTDMEQAAT